MEVLNMSAVTKTPQRSFLMNKKIIFSLMLVIILAFVAVVAFGQSSQNVRWEYAFITRSSQSAANELGAQGWELVAVDTAVSTQNSLLIFKRKLP